MTVSVEPHLAGSREEGEYRCRACGFAAVAAVAPEACPMCRGHAWAWVPRRRTGANEARDLDVVLTEAARRR